MTAITRRRLGAVSAAGAIGLLAAACGSEGSESAATSGAGASDAGGDAAASSVTIEDNDGEKTIALPLASVVATDNRTFQTLFDWDVKLSAAAVSLMPETIGYTKDDSIVDLGNHREPNLELLVAAQPDLVVNGQRFTQFQEDIEKLVPEATVLSLDPRDDQPFADELKRQITVLGQVFGKEAEAEALNGDFDAAIERVTAAYTPGEKVMAVITSGGEIGYSAPGNGRTFGPLFELFGFTPALEVPESSDDHQGDDVSVEAIAQSNPDWLLVMDRDAAVAADEPDYKPAQSVLESSAALTSVTAVAEGNIVYMPADTYTNEGIQTYTTFFTALAEALEAKK
ncbi:siderophore ABC transporter substrate-binding protein [Brachybacterium hainanense]|uniref:Siderophore ABC transporter substrate-binding protein n=1 Tax=Brachybacterium hainanense TaxID=1541174 RepID=A0ABV6R9T2_9MICO